MSSRKTSSIWNPFSQKSKSDTVAICNTCKQELSYKSTYSNLKKHIQRKHPTVRLYDDTAPGPSTSISGIKESKCIQETNNNSSIKISR